MATLVMLLRVFRQTVPSAERTYKITKWVTLAFGCANIAFFIASVSKASVGFCKSDYPISLGGLAIKLLLVLFDLFVFAWYCCGFSIKNDEIDPEVVKETSFLK